jgi:hypothetical protein
LASEATFCSCTSVSSARSSAGGFLPRFNFLTSFFSRLLSFLRRRDMTATLEGTERLLLCRCERHVRVGGSGHAWQEKTATLSFFVALLPALSVAVTVTTSVIPALGTSPNFPKLATQFPPLGVSDLEVAPFWSEYGAPFHLHTIDTDWTPPASLTTAVISEFFGVDAPQIPLFA